MIQTCLNHRQMTYEFCRRCPHGRDLDCPEYLVEIEQTPMEDINVNRGVQAKPSAETFSESYSRSQGGDKFSKSTRANSISTAPPEKPFYFGHVELMHELVLPRVNARMFMSRFRRSDGR